MQKKIILIGGAPTAGKSYFARKIAEELKLPWISTDTIRDQMRKIVRKKDYPRLFFHSGAGPEVVSRYLSKNTAKQIVKNQNEESRDVWKGVKAIIETDYVWGSFIIEGVAILPHLVAKMTQRKKEIKAIFILDEDIDRIRKTIFTRGLCDDADKYPDKLKEKEVEWVLEFNKFIKSEAKKYGLPVVVVGDREKCYKQIKEIVSK